MSGRHERRRAREIAVQLLYEEDITGDPSAGSSENVSVIFDENPVPAYTKKLIADVADHKNVIDQLISDASENWSLDRMPVVDRAIMRMAVSEMLYEDSVPVSVCINEAVELAKQFGGEDESPQFTNGILGNIARREKLDSPKTSSVDKAQKARVSVTPEVTSEPKKVAQTDQTQTGQGNSQTAPELSGDNDV